LSHLEYLLFNLLVAAGPLALSFEPKVRYLRRWPAALLSAALMLLPYALWDTLVTGRHWWFNPRYTAGTFIGPLPAGEWLFFITVPFAALFVWEVLRFYRPHRHAAAERRPPHWLWPALPLAGLMLWLGKEYTALVIAVFAVTAWADLRLGGRVLARANVLPYAALLAGLMLIFNGYLTARPVVLYDPAYQLDWLIGTIPVEDFLYGYSLLLGCTSLFEKFRSRHD